MMRFLTLFCFSCSLLLTNCQDDKVSGVIKETQDQIDARTIYQRDIEALRYADYGLSTDSQKAVIDWQKFQELNIQIELLKKGDFNFFKQDFVLLKTFLLEFRAEMPQQLQTNEILARTIAFETKAQKLNSLLTISNISKDEQLQGIEELLITVSNLNLQMNKKFEFDKNNIIKPE
jgi:hypothetical protein